MAIPWRARKDALYDPAPIKITANTATPGLSIFDSKSMLSHDISEYFYLRQIFILLNIFILLVKNII